MILEGFCGISMFGCTDVRRRMHFDSHAHGNDTNSYNMVCVYSRLDGIHVFCLHMVAGAFMDSCKSADIPAITPVALEWSADSCK